MTIQFKIQIRGIKKPPVWRRIVIPSDFSFHDLHNTIQAAFGWWDMHLYQFQRHPFDNGWTVKKPDEEDDIWGERPNDSRETNVATFIQHMGLEKFVYVYDFGDSWVHDITVESIDREAELSHPVCLAGKSACPPENCGGPWGYEELKEKMDKDDIIEFDLEEVNEDLESITAGEEDPGEFTDSINDYDVPDDAKDLEKMSLVDILQKFCKSELTGFAEEMGFDIDMKLSEEEVRKQYAQALIDHPVEVLSMLPLEDLEMLARLKTEPKPGNIAQCYEDYREQIMELYGLADHWWDEDDNYYLWIPVDLWTVLKPHIEEVMDLPHVKHRLSIESTILGLANLYGQVSLGLVHKELVRLGQLQTIEDATVAVAACREKSLLLKWNAHQIGGFLDEPTDDNQLFLSPYSWDMPAELVREIEKHESLAGDYQQFSAMDVMAASVMPIPTIPNPAHDDFFSMLTDELELDDQQATAVCHDLWYREMHKYEEDFDEEDAGTYFRESVLYDYDSYDYIFKKGMKMLDDYLNNMPHWQLKGHTPAEAQDCLSKLDMAARQERQRRSHQDGDYVRPKDYFSGLSVTMPIIAEKKPGRNDPCPCGSGKKYKNCCGKGN
ncbi:MAG: SEC-C domain-containing protein [Prevotella sp.]|nr:SEC-C domain-containing protein [Prevotella sp.]